MMKNRIRILSVIIALFTLFTVFSLTAYATDEVTPPVDTPVDPPVVDPPVVDPDPGTDPNPPVDPGTDPDTPVDPGTDPDTPVDPGTDPDTPVDPNPDTGTVTPPTGGYITGDDFYYYDEDTMANSIEQSAGSVSDATNQYDTSDINVSALKETKWDDIVIDVSKGTSDAMDFSAIKKNTRNNDDGQWILYLGYAFIALSVAGIMYFIIATTTYKKNLQKASVQQYGSYRARDDYGDNTDYASSREHRSRPQRKRYATDGMGYAERKRAMADTAEINLPDNYKARH